MCQLTGTAMEALVRVEQALTRAASAGAEASGGEATGGDTAGGDTAGELSALEFRALMWARCSLATLYGIRADETVADSLSSFDVLGIAIEGCGSRFAN